MSRKFDAPFLEVTFWCPIPGFVWRALRKHPIPTAILNEALDSLRSKRGENDDNPNQ